MGVDLFLLENFESLESLASLASLASQERPVKQIPVSIRMSRMGFSLSLGAARADPNLNAADFNSLSPSLRKVKLLRDRLFRRDAAEGLRDYIAGLYEEDSDAIKAGLNTSYKIADEHTTLCIDVVQNSKGSGVEAIPVIDILIDLGADINRWNTASGKYRDHAENALTWAVTTNKGQLVKHLITRRATADAAGDHSGLLSHFAGHLSPKQRRKLRMALGGHSPRSGVASREGSGGGAGGGGPRSGTASREASAGGAPGPISHSRESSGAGGTGAGTRSRAGAGTRSRAGSHASGTSRPGSRGLPASGVTSHVPRKTRKRKY